jgi:nucleotide-binding universal stress UspA family protein
MYRRLLIATDGSQLSAKAVSTGVELAGELGAAITVIHVSETWATDCRPDITEEPFWIKYDAACAAQVGIVLDAAARKASDAGVACTVRHLPNRYVADGILEAAEESGSDFIVVASHGRRGIARFVMGSQANEVLVRSKHICR